MPAKSTNTNYGAVAISIHWISAAFIIAALISGFRAANATDLTVKVQVLSVHVPFAIAVVFLTLARAQAIFVIFGMVVVCRQKAIPPCGHTKLAT